MMFSFVLSLSFSLRVVVTKPLVLVYVVLTFVLLGLRWILRALVGPAVFP